MMTMRAWTVVLAGCGVMLAGCSGVQRPRAEVVAVAAGEASAEGSVVTFTVLLDNPNDVALPVTQVSYEVSLGERVFTFDATPPVTMPVFGQQSVTLPAAFAAPAAGQAVSVSGRIFYQPPGKVREALTDMKVPLPHVGFASTATLE